MITRKEIKIEMERCSKVSKDELEADFERLGGAEALLEFARNCPVDFFTGLAHAISLKTEH